MTFDEYQKKAQATAMTTDDAFMDATVQVLGISGEASEIAEKWKKIIIYEKGDISPDRREELAKEIGDVLWYLATFAECLGLSLADIAEANIDKLTNRKERGVIPGEGDNR